MAIKKMSSQDFNDIIKNTGDKIAKINNDVYLIKNNMDSKLKVIKYSIEYMNSKINTLNNSSFNDGCFIMLKDNKGLYERYGDYVHAAFKSNPVNLFNVIPINSSNIFYNDEVYVSVNGVQDDFYKNIMKDENITDKKIFFEEYEKNKTIKEDTEGTAYLESDNKITISITLNKEKIYGINKFNIIEIDPFLMQSFDIEEINIYDTSDTTPSYTIKNIKNADTQRIILDKKYLFNRVDFLINPKYSVTTGGKEIIPFGLKHIFFYDADFRNDSYIEIPFESENYIDSIEDKIILYTSNGPIEASLSEQNMKIYLDNLNGILATEQLPSKNIENKVARNINKIYIRMPIGSDNSLLTYCNPIYAVKLFINFR